MPPKKPTVAKGVTKPAVKAKQTTGEKHAKDGSNSKTEPTSKPATESGPAVVNELPIVTVNIRKLDDVLFKDVGNNIKDSHRSPLVLDPSTTASTFLRHRDTNYLNALDKEDMTSEKIRMALLGGVRFGKPVVLDMMEVDLYETCSTRFDELQSGLFESLVDLSFIAERKYLTLVRSTDGDQYADIGINDQLTNKFSFIVVTSASRPNEYLRKNMYPIRIA